MNAVQLQSVITNALNQALNSGQTAPGQAVAVLEFAKLDIFMQTKALEKAQPTILPANGNLPPFLGARG